MIVKCGFMGSVIGLGMIWGAGHIAVHRDLTPEEKRDSQVWIHGFSYWPWHDMGSWSHCCTQGSDTRREKR